MIYDDLDRHMEQAGSIDRAATPLGMYVAWCANLQLVSRQLQDRAEQLILRVRYREATGAELLVGGCAGTLDAHCLNEEGQRFTEAYYPRYMEDFRAVFGDAVYDVKDDWAHYDEIAKLLTKRYMHHRGVPGSKGSLRGSPWWKFWQ